MPNNRSLQTFNLGLCIFWGIASSASAKHILNHYHHAPKPKSPAAPQLSFKIGDCSAFVSQAMMHIIHP